MAGRKKSSGTEKNGRGWFAFWLLLLAVVAVALAIWQWQGILSLFNGNNMLVGNTVTHVVWGLFGWGIIPVLGVPLTIAFILFSPKRRTLQRYWCQWFALIIFGVFAWGLLAWFEIGGVLGERIISTDSAMGFLRLLILALAGIFMLSPRTSCRLLYGSVAWIGGTSRKFKITALAIILTVIVFGVLFWQRSTITAWGNDIASSIWGVFGWGLILLILGILIVASTIWRKQISEFVQNPRFNNWNMWLGGIALLIATWGILGIFSLGGSVGSNIIGVPLEPFIGMLRIMGLLALGIILIMIKSITRRFCYLVAWLKQPKHYRPEPVIPAHGQSYQQKDTLSQQRTPAAKNAAGDGPDIEKSPYQPTTAMARKIPSLSKNQPVGELSAKTEKKDLKQVALDVWRKYGETSTALERDGWKLPPIDILDKVEEVQFSEADNLKRAQLIENSLASYGVDGKVVQINVGPAVTQFGVEPGWDRKLKQVKKKDSEGKTYTEQKEISRTRVKVDRITSLSNDLALALAAPSIRIEAPVPGKSIVGIEVPNTVTGRVSLRSVIESSGFQKLSARSSLAVALGKGAGGEAMTADLTKMPHLLIAGATGSGKTVCLNAIICCLLLQNTPNDVRLILIDPKRVELTPFNGIPQMAAPVIVDTDKALGTLRWLGQEMDKRYKTMAKEGVRNIEGYNKNRTGKDCMNYLVLVIDELADLMMAGSEEVEHILCRLAQLARATGIHLVVATQRPSVDVVTGLIKANFPTRISFAVTSQVDSRTILDSIGAEKLLGRGDMLYMPSDAAKPKRLQGCYVSDPETERLVYFWSGQKNSEEEADLSLTDLKISQVHAVKKEYPEDPLMEQARQIKEEHGNISASYLQRRLHIGYNRAARIFETMQEEDDSGDVGEEFEESEEEN